MFIFTAFKFTASNDFWMILILTLTLKEVKIIDLFYRSLLIKKLLMNNK